MELVIHHQRSHKLSFIILAGLTFFDSMSLIVSTKIHHQRWATEFHITRVAEISASMCRIHQQRLPT